MALAAWGPSWALPICSSGTLCSVVHEMGLPVSGSTQWHITGPNLCHAVTLTGMLRNKTMLKLPCCELVQTKSWIHIDKQLLSLNLTAHHAGRARLACPWASLFRKFKSGDRPKWKRMHSSSAISNLDASPLFPNRNERTRVLSLFSLAALVA